MKLRLTQIPPEGLRQTLMVRAAALPRVQELTPEQSGELHAELLLKERKGHVEVRGRLTGGLRVPCNRCLDDVPLELAHEVEVTLVAEQEGRKLTGDVQLSDGDLDVSFFDDDEIDLLALIEEEILLYYPDWPCTEDEAGRCTRCKHTLEELYAAEAGDEGRHPFAKMKDLLS